MSTEERETVSFRAVWKKTNYDITFCVDDRIAKLKQHIQELTGEETALRHGDERKCSLIFCPGIPPAMMKLMYKGKYAPSVCRCISIRITSEVSWFLSATRDRYPLRNRLYCLHAVQWIAPDKLTDGADWESKDLSVLITLFLCRGCDVYEAADGCLSFGCKKSRWSVVARLCKLIFCWRKNN